MNIISGTFSKCAISCCQSALSILRYGFYYFFRGYVNNTIHQRLNIHIILSVEQESVERTQHTDLRFEERWGCHGVAVRLFTQSLLLSHSKRIIYTKATGCCCRLNIIILPVPTPLSESIVGKSLGLFNMLRSL